MEYEPRHQDIVFQNSEFPIATILGKHVYSGYTEIDMEIPFWHEELEIKLYKKGRATLMIENERLEVHAGDLIIINPYESHCTLLHDTDAEYDYIILNVRYFYNLLNIQWNEEKFKLFEAGKLKLNRIVRSDKIKAILNMLLDESDPRRSRNDLAVTGLTIYLFSRLFESEIRCDADETLLYIIKSRKKIEPAMQYLNEHFSEPYSESLLAELCSLNRQYFCRLFKRVVGINVQTYVERIRLKKARILLESTEICTPEIAAEVGLKDVNYFYRWFKRRTGQTPTEYRRRVKPPTAEG